MRADSAERRGERIRRKDEGDPAVSFDVMPDNEIDVRELPPSDRHPKIHEAFEALDSGESLTLVNDHDPKPLFYEFQAEVDAFDADAYDVERDGPERFVATLPKK